MLPTLRSTFWIGLGLLLGSPHAHAQAPSAVIQDWVRMWNSYDLDLVDRLFVNDSTVTYFSSERPGLIAGIAALREHHVGFGFVPGGTVTGNRLWLEGEHQIVTESAALVTATWKFQRHGDTTVQRGPVTFVLVSRDTAFRILHAHFSNDPHPSDREFDLP